jgi:lipooligosaccharide transport system permease protein
MFVFCGVFFEVNKFPDFIQSLSWFFPMTHLVMVIRPLTTGLPIDLITILTHGSYFVVGGLVAFSLAYFKIRLKLFD